MRSIRRSLIVYFLVLSALALGAVSLLVYQTTERTLRAKKASTRELLLNQHEERCQKERDTLDKELLSQAYTLAAAAQIRYESHRGRFHGVNPVELWLSLAGPNVPLMAPLWVMEGARSRVTWRLRHLTVTEMQFNEEALRADFQMPEYFQINTEWGKAWRSASMEDDHFPFNREVFDRTPFFKPQFDDEDVVLSSGAVVRRVTLKVPVVRFSFLSGPPRPGSSGRPSRSEKPPEKPAGPPPPRLHSSPAILIHCAAKTGERDAALLEAQGALDDQLADLEVQSRETLAWLRNQLLLIGLAAFAALLLGSFGLIRVGLSPLQRLSEAVSRVSVKDFRLPLDDRPLPRELSPIVERLNQALDLLKRAFAREKQAAADISHELRTPLAALLTTIEVALRKKRSPEEYRELLEDCRASGQQMNQLVEHLLTMARLDAGVDLFRPCAVDVAALARQCANLVRPLVEAHGLSLLVKCHEPASLTTDPDKLREVVTNLLHNAIEYNRPQGFVALEVGRQNGHLRLEVRDSGIGIPSEAREHIFERFYRADPSRQADGLHAGLGLSIVKGYVDLMGGTIAVESEPGEGSTFRVELPAGEDDGVTG